MDDACRGLAARIDHALLRPEATEAQLAKVCDEALTHGFGHVCVNPAHVAQATALLAGGAVGVCAVVGFPLGGSAAEIKAAEAACAVADGAAGIDMVLRIGALKSGRHDLVRADIAAVRAACPGTVLTVALECCLLDDDEKRVGCRLAVEAGADSVNTSTGFSTGGATVHDVRLLRGALGGTARVKASGGIRSGRTAREMLSAGADRIGSSCGVTLLAGLWRCGERAGPGGSPLPGTLRAVEAGRIGARISRPR